MFGLMSRAEHERVLAEDRDAAQAVIAKANAACNTARDRANQSAATAVRAQLLAADRAKEIRVLTIERDEARARLAKFTAPRKRDARGHFVKDGG